MVPVNQSDVDRLKIDCSNLCNMYCFMSFSSLVDVYKISSRTSSASSFSVSVSIVGVLSLSGKRQ